MPEVSWIAVLACGLATLGIGGLWYSPLLFARTWQREAVRSEGLWRARSSPLTPTSPSAPAPRPARPPAGP